MVREYAHGAGIIVKIPPLLLSTQLGQFGIFVEPPLAGEVFFVY